MRAYIQTTLIILVLNLFSSHTALAITWADLWKSQDQQAAEVLKQGHATQAAKQFKDPAWRAAANYRAKNYSKAAQGFAQQNSATGFYNLGNALAHLGDYEKAIAAYQEALKRDPNLSDAKHNLDIIKKLRKKQPPQKNQSKHNKQASSKNSKDQKNSKNNTPDNKKQNNQKSNQQQSASNQQKIQQHTSNANKQTDQAGKEQASNPKTQTGRQQPHASKQQSAETASQRGEQKSQADLKQETNPEQQTAKQAQQAPMNENTRQWLRKIPDNPGGLLRQKFLRDHIRNRNAQREGKTLW